MHYQYRTAGTCSRLIDIDVSDDGVIENVVFTGGCNGNLKGIGELVKGMRPEDVIPKIQGIKCGFKSTSCPDQLSKALSEIIKVNSR